MGSAGDDGKRGPVPDAPRAKPDRLAEALRANLKRRKAQTRAREDGRPGDPPPDARTPERDG